MKYCEIMACVVNLLKFVFNWPGKSFLEKIEITLKWKLILFNIQFYFNSDNPEVIGKTDLLKYSKDVMNMYLHFSHLFFNKT